MKSRVRRMVARNRASGVGIQGRARRAGLEALEPRHLLAATLLADINLDTPGSGATQYTRLGDEVLFVANDGTGVGSGLWKTNGTEAGTTRLLGTSLGSTGTPITMMPAFSEQAVLFWATTELHGKELWRTDGTVAGTYLVKDINPGPASSPRASGSSGGFNPPDQPVIIDGVLYFQANDGTHGLELWRSDGTESGTYLVKDIWPGTTQSSIAYQVAVDGALYFAAGDSTGSQKKLFRSDGTEAGTTPVSDTDFLAPRDLTAVGERLYFFTPVTGSTTQYVLYRGDGTAAGTSAVSSSLTLTGTQSPVGGSGSASSGAMAVGDALYFSASDGINGFEPWRSDAAGNTAMVKNIGAADLSSAPLNFIDVNGITYFTTAGSTRAIWRSDGTDAGTFAVPGAARGRAAVIGTPLVAIDDIVYYAGVDPVTSAFELYRTDGTATGSFALTDDFWSTNVWPINLAAINGTLYFTNSTITQGAEPWTSDGTAAGTVQITDLNAQQTIGSTPRDLAVFGNVGYFSANRGETGRELWRTDGTTPGTYLLKDINPGRASSAPSHFTAVGGIVYFLASDGTHGQELWRTDGTEAGTYLVKDVQLGANAGATPRFAVLNNMLYFSGTDGPYKTQLWKTDGTEAGTVMVKDFSPGGTSMNFIYSPLAYNGQLYLGVGNYTTAELWRTDGTEAGTHKAFGDSPPSALIGVDNLRVANNTLFFTTNTSTNAYKLFRSDGTLANTTRVSAPTGLPGDAKALSVIEDKLYFWGTGGGNGYEPHVTDGTTEGSFKLREINPGSASSGNSSNFSPFVAGGGSVYFGAIDSAVIGEQLWRTDGTAGGTEKLGGPTASLPGRAAWLDGRLYFTALASGSGYELWSYDAASGAIVPAADIRAGSSGSSPIDIKAINGRLVFNANDGVRGEELWGYVPTIASPGGPYTVAEGGSIPLVGAGVDPAGGQIIAYEWDFNYAPGGGFSVDATGQAATFIAQSIDGRDAPTPTFRTIALRVTDALGGQAIATQQVRITNVAPTLHELGGEIFVPVNSYFRPTFTFDDPGAEQITVTAQYGEGTTPHHEFVNPGTPRKVMLSNYFTEVGSFLLTVTVRDTDGATDSDSVMVHVTPGLPVGITRDGDGAFYRQDDRIIVTGGVVTFGPEADLANVEVISRPLASLVGSAQFSGSVKALAITADPGGRIEFASDSGNILEVERVNVAPSGFVDLMGNAMIVTGQSLTDVDALLKLGRNNGNWLGSGGIGSNTANTGGGRTALAATTAANVLMLSPGQNGTWNGRVVAPSAVLVKYTWGGDANLDGRVNIDDYGRIDSMVSQSGSVWGWFNGDFNYDGFINIDDYGIIDANVSAQGLPL